MQASATCPQKDCEGQVGVGLSACLAHLEDAARNAYLEEVRKGRQLEARGVRFSAALFDQTTRHLGFRPSGGSTYVNKLSRQRGGEDAAGPGGFHFDGAVFEAAVSLDAMVFPVLASFAGARFLGELSAATEFGSGVSFEDAVFSKAADFTDSLIDGTATFAGAEFRQEATFTGAKFAAPASFKAAKFRAGAVFANDVDKDGVLFESAVDFSGARFKGPLQCQKRSGSEEGDFRFDATAPPTFADRATFHGTAFEGPTIFDRARFNTAFFRGASFSSAASFAGATFDGRATFDEIACPELRMREATFGDVASFASAHVDGLLELASAKCASDLVFNEAFLGGRIDVTLLHVRGRAWFIRCQVESARDFGPIAAYDKLDLDHATFTAGLTSGAAPPGWYAVQGRFDDAKQVRRRIRTPTRLAPPIRSPDDIVLPPAHAREDRPRTAHAAPEPRSETPTAAETSARTNS